MRKGMKPSMRPRKRYVAFRVYCDDRIEKEEFIRSLWGEATAFFGEERAAELNLWVMDYHPETGTGFLVCRHDRLEVVRGALGLVGRIGGRRAGIGVLGVSGTVKSLKRKFLNKVEKFKEEKGKIDFEGDAFNLVRSHGEFIDAVPERDELKARLKEQNRRFIGLTRKDIGW
ncbi:MAG: hypothetical protein GXO65_06475 [Euryarchaeota archaeon]|nr:hypothetical protein [Euryarchaeota archaeon]